MTRTTKKTVETDEDGFVHYVSVLPERVAFNFGDYPPGRLEDGRLFWRIDAERAAAYDLHHWVQTGKIARKGSVVA